MVQNAPVEPREDEGRAKGGGERKCMEDRQEAARQQFRSDPLRSQYHPHTLTNHVRNLPTSHYRVHPLLPLKKNRVSE